MPILGLPVQLVGDGGMVERPLPVTREPLELAQPPEDLPPGAVIPASGRIRLQLLENGPGLVELTHAHEEPRTRHARAFVVLERQPQALLDLHSALE